MPTTNSTVRLADADRHLRTFAQKLTDWTPYWRELAERLAETAQARWPLRRLSGRLRRSLTWAGSRLGRGGVYEADPNMLRFGTSVFYGRFHQHGAKHTPRRPLIHVDEPAHTKHLTDWLRARAVASGLEVT